MPVIKSSPKSNRITPLTDKQRDIVEKNFKLVYYVINRCGHRWHRLNSDEILSECMYGLLKASRMFDPSLGYKFSTYACWCMMRHTTSINCRIRKDATQNAMSLSGRHEKQDFDIFGDVDDSGSLDENDNIDHLLSLVPNDDRDVIVRHLLRGEKYSTIAKSTGKHISSVRHKYSNAIRRIGLILREKRIMEVRK
jgi:RNA polymerase sigma factor (sigma-70 family)